jgi:hypothetical protein
MDSVIFVLSLKRIVNFSDLASSDVFPFGNTNDFPSSNDEFPRLNTGVTTPKKGGIVSVSERRICNPVLVLFKFCHFCPYTILPPIHAFTLK